MKAMSPTTDREVKVRRTLNAPVERVYRVWTDPGHISSWFGPNGFAITTHEMSVAPGGVWRFTMHGPDGKDWPNTITYDEVVPNQRLVYDHGDFDAPKFRVTVTFTPEADGRTTVEMHTIFPTVEALETVKKFGALELGQQTMDKMAAYATAQPAQDAGKANPILEVRRVFNAPLDRVYRACTEAEHLAHWWGPKGFTMKVAKLDLRPGGVFHYSMLTPDGQEMWGKFDYLDVEPNRKLVFTNCFSNAEGGVVRHPMAATWPLEVLNVWHLSEADGKTTLHMIGQPYQATAEEAATFEGAKTNVQGGMKGTFDQLEAYLAQ